MRRILSILISLSLILLLAACGIETGEEESSPVSVVSTDHGAVHAAVIAACGDISDQGYNQTVYEICRDFCEDSHMDFGFYKSEENSTEAHLSAIAEAVSEGCNLLVLPGTSFAPAVVQASELYPEVKFVALDVSKGDLLAASLGDKYNGDPEPWTVTDFYHWENVTCGDFQEEQAGYLAGYAAVAMGYSRLGFAGTADVSSRRYGQGFVQGADAAAEQSGSEVSLQYVTTEEITGSDALTETAAAWYDSGTEVIMACGGSIYTSVAEAAKKYDGKVIGASCDQTATIDKKYGDGITVTSAAKNLSDYLELVLAAVAEDRWNDIAGRTDVMGLTSSADPSRNGVFLPVSTTAWTDSFTEEDYTALVESICTGEIVVHWDPAAAQPAAGHLALQCSVLESSAGEE